MPSSTLRAMLDGIPTPVLLVNASSQTTYANPAAAALTDWRVEELVDLPLATLIPTGIPSSVQFRRSLSARERALLPASSRATVRCRAGREVNVTLRVLSLEEDRSESSLLLVLETDHAAVELERQIAVTCDLRAVVDLASRLEACSDLETTLETAIQGMLGAFGARLAQVWLMDPRGKELRLAAAGGCGKGGPGDVPCAVREAVRTGIPVFAPREAAGPEALPECLQHACPGSMAAVPLHEAGRLRGALFATWDAVLPEERHEGPALLAGHLSGVLTRQASAVQPAGHAAPATPPDLELVSRLAGGVGHELNNMLAVINGYSALVLSQLAPEDPSRQALECIQGAGERAAELSRQLLAFGQRQLLTPRVTDLGRLIRAMERRLREKLGAGVDLRVQVEPGLRPARVDEEQLRAVIHALAFRARDAMADGGCLTIEARNETMEAGATLGSLPPGSYVELVLSDTGHPLDPEAQARCFEPFFQPEGSPNSGGLRLPAVYGTVRQSGGHVEVESAAGQGTRFHLYFPAVGEG